MIFTLFKKSSVTNGYSFIMP